MPGTERRNGSLPMLLTALAILLAALALLPSPALADSRKKVLILNSYSPGYKWTDDIIRGVDDTFHKGGLDIHIRYEPMAAKLAADPEYFRLLYHAYRYKFKNVRFDAIVAADNDAFDFLVKYRDRLFPQTPVIFCGVKYPNPSELRGLRLFTGVEETTDLKATLDLALKLHPRTRQILVINDTTTIGRAVHDQLAGLLPSYRGRVSFSFLENTDFKEIIDKVQKLPPDSLIFYTFFFRDRFGEVYDFDESISLIAQHSPVPIYGAWDFNLGYGIVGGKLTCGYLQGEIAGALALRVLKGERIEKIPMVTQSPNRYMFDYRQLRRFGIDKSELPQGSIIINRPLDLYTVHKATIWGIVAAIAALMLIILLMTRSMTLKKRAEEGLRRFADQLEMRVQERTRELENSQRALEKQNQVLQETYRGLQQEMADRIRVMEELRVKDQMLIHQSRMAAMGEMLGNIAHQWRQPLNVLGLKIQELGLSYRLGSFSKELLDANVSKSMEILQHMSQTIDDFRAFSTPDKRKVHFKVKEVLEKTLSLVEESFRDHGIDLQWSSSGDPEIEGFPNEYAQVLLNILMNARDAFHERQTTEPRIEIRAWTEDGRSEVTISDNAGGIDQAIIDKIFDAYFTTKEIGKGTGVGLFMSKKIIEKNMGGSLRVRNTTEGAEFRITV